MTGESEVPAGSEAPIGEAAPIAPDPAAETPLTRAEFMRFTSELEAKLNRGFQSWGDRLDARMAQRLQGELSQVNAWVEQNKRLGIEVPPDKIEKAKQEAYERAVLKPSQAPPGGDGSQPSAEAAGQNLPDDIPPQVLQVAQDALGYMRVMGIEIEENDPEAGLLKLDAQSPQEFMASVKEAVEAKRQRLEGAEAAAQDEASKRKRSVAPPRGVSKPTSSDAGRDSMSFLNEAYKQS